MSDIAERLRKPLLCEETMQQWDGWRKYIKDGGGASWPRDAFESLLDCADEDRREAAKEIDRLQKEIADLAAEVVRLRNHEQPFQ